MKRIRTVKKSDTLKRKSRDVARIRRVTKAIMKGKKINAKVDWENIRRQAMASAPDMTPEEEVRRGRMRGVPEEFLKS